MNAQLGLFLLSCDPLIAEVCGQASLDWIVVDGEASPVASKDRMLCCLQALKGTGIAPFIRVPEASKHTIEHCLDLGPKGLIIPKVDNVEIAKSIAMAGRYPPLGMRGLNPVRASEYFTDIGRYVTEANQYHQIILQIESKEAVENAVQIAAVDGIDGLFIGAGDLSLSLGCLGEMNTSAMKDARAKVLAACRSHGKIAGIFANDLELANLYRNEGFTFIAVGNELKFMKNAIQSAVLSLKPPHQGV